MAQGLQGFGPLPRGCHVGAVGLTAEGQAGARRVLRCPGGPWTPTASILALVSLSAKGFETQLASAVTVPTPSLSS